MVLEITVLSHWIPEQMKPGAVFLLKKEGGKEESGDANDVRTFVGGYENDPLDPFWAVLSCPQCGTLGLITKNQSAGLIYIICGSSSCPAEFMLQYDGTIVPRKKM